MMMIVIQTMVILGILVDYGVVVVRLFHIFAASAAGAGSAGRRKLQE